MLVIFLVQWSCQCDFLEQEEGHWLAGQVFSLDSLSSITSKCANASQMRKILRCIHGFKSIHSVSGGVAGARNNCYAMYVTYTGPKRLCYLTTQRSAIEWVYISTTCY